MTLSDINRTYGCVQELIQQGHKDVSVWEYRHAMTKKTLYAVFVDERYCDIYESPYVERPIRIYKQGKWLGVYEYLNHIED